MAATTRTRASPARRGCEGKSIRLRRSRTVAAHGRALQHGLDPDSPWPPGPRLARRAAPRGRSSSGRTPRGSQSTADQPCPVNCACSSRAITRTSEPAVRRAQQSGSVDAEHARRIRQDSPALRARSLCRECRRAPAGLRPAPRPARGFRFCMCSLAPTSGPSTAAHPRSERTPRTGRSRCGNGSTSGRSCAAISGPVIDGVDDHGAPRRHSHHEAARAHRRWRCRPSPLAATAGPAIGRAVGTRTTALPESAPEKHLSPAERRRGRAGPAVSRRLRPPLRRSSRCRGSPV